MEINLIISMLILMNIILTIHTNFFVNINKNVNKNIQIYFDKLLDCYFVHMSAISKGIFMV